MTIKLRFVLFIFILFLLNSCNRHNALTDPYSFAPRSSNSSWAPLKNSTVITSKYCSPLFPTEYKEEDNLTLAELVDIALMNNPTTKQSWADARSAAARYGQSLSKYLPEINFDASYTRERQTSLNTVHSLPGHGKKHEAYYRTIAEPEATLSYMIYDFGKRKNSSESAKQALYYADWMHNRQLQDVMQTVMNSYYDYQYEKQLLIAITTDLENADTSLDAANQKFISGTASVGDVVQAKTKYLQVKMDLIKQGNNVETSYADLLNNLGVPSNQKIKIENLPENAEIDFVLDNLDNLINTAENMRQDFLAAKANVKYSIAQLNFTKSAELPNIDSYFEIGKNYYDQGIQEDYHFQAAFKLSIPLFKGLYHKNAIKNAKGKLLKSQAELEQTELEIIKEVTISHSTVSSSASTLSCSKDYLAEANKRFNIALANYKAGTGTILDVVAAQSSLADARAKKAKADKDWFSSIANLAYSTGALCTPDKNINMDKANEK